MHWLYFLIILLGAVLIGAGRTLIRRARLGLSRFTGDSATFRPPLSARFRGWLLMGLGFFFMLVGVICW